MPVSPHGVSQIQFNLSLSLCIHPYMHIQTCARVHAGQYSRGRERWGGACEEQHATEIYPARIAERDGMLGAAVLTGPACKGGAWDVDPEGISTCDVHALKFNGSLGTSGYSGRFERGTPASQSCLIRRQPNLETFAVVHRGVKALRFDGAINRGLLVSNAIDALLDQDRLPKGAFSLELQMTVGSAATAGREVRALAAAQQDSAGLVGDGSLYSKGWSLVYETDSVKGSLTLRFAVALEANNDANDHGRLRFLTHSLPTLAVEDEQWTHLVAVYDQRMLRLYVNGSLAAEAPACEEGDADATGCGAIVYPLATDPLARQATPFTLGSYENRQTGLSASHVGLLAEVRLFRGALPPHIISAAARRLMMGNPDGYCEEGESGTYQGLKPCDPCAPGSYSDEPRRDSCELCPRGLWQDGSGRTLCLSCPVHMTTKAPGAAAEAECLEPDECATWSGLLNPCHPNATCTKIQSNLSVVAPGQNPPVCTCNPGYHGDGYNCSASCGDGIVVPGEPCDDGNTLDSDGCSSTCTVEPDFVCPSNPDAPHLQSACECTADGEICCARAYVKCLLEASRFTAVGHGHASPGLDSNGCMTERLADPTWHLAHAGEHCADACARVPSAGSPEGGDHECVAHSTEMSSLQYLQSVSLPAAAGQDIAALHTTVGVGSGAKMGQDVLTRQARHRSARAGLFCSRVVNTSSNTGLAARLVPESLPMVDEFSASGERGLIGNAIGGDDGAPDVELICYVHDDGVPTVEAMDEWCFARATVPTGRRMCRCRHKPNRCSRDCLAEQARCNARVASRDHRLASAAEVHSPCYDDPNYRGRFFDNITAVNISLNNCSAVADFLWRASLNVSQLRASFSLNISAEELNRTRSWNDSDADGTGSTLQQRFALSASCGCGACPVACGTCDKCYQEGGTYFYGGSHVAHPTRLKHPSSLHGVAAPAMLAQCAAGDDECFEAGCKKALAYCASHGLSKCLDDVVCWKSEYDSNSCPDAYAPWVGRPSEYRPPVEQVREDEVSCECMAWFHNCLLRARWGGM